MKTIQFDKPSARRTILDLELKLPNRKFAEQWLSLWQENELPADSGDAMARLMEVFPATVVVDVVPDRTAIVRRASAIVTESLGMNLAGRDWVALAPSHHRTRRLQIFSEIVAGAIGRGLRCVAIDTGSDHVCEELLLPFAPQENGVCAVLCNVDWNPGGKVKSVREAMGEALAFETVPLLQISQKSAVAE